MAPCRALAAVAGLHAALSASVLARLVAGTPGSAEHGSAPRLQKHGEVLRVTMRGSPMSWRQVLASWSHDPDFRASFTRSLRETAPKAFFWEMPAVSRATLGQAYEFVALSASGWSLDRTPADPSAFAEFFGPSFVAQSSGIVSFRNLGGDATLVVPRPPSNTSAGAPLAAYGHLGAFLRGAPARQVDALWAELGAQIQRRLESSRVDEAVYVSTAGLGVPWLHVRLDSRPKYYQYEPYKNPKYYHVPWGTIACTVAVLAALALARAQASRLHALVASARDWASRSHAWLPVQRALHGGQTGQGTPAARLASLHLGSWPWIAASTVLVGVFLALMLLVMGCDVCGETCRFHPVHVRSFRISCDSDYYHDDMVGLVMWAWRRSQPDGRCAESFGHYTSGYILLKRTDSFCLGPQCHRRLREVISLAGCPIVSGFAIKSGTLHPISGTFNCASAVDSLDSQSNCREMSPEEQVVIRKVIEAFKRHRSAGVTFKHDEL